MAQQRQQQFRKLPGKPPHESASLSAGSISCSRSSIYQSRRLRTARLQVRFLPGVPIRRVGPSLGRRPPRGASLSTERSGVDHNSRQRTSFLGHPTCGGLGKPNPSRGTNLAHVVQCRDGALKTRTVSVQIRPWAPGFAPSFCSVSQPRVAQLAEASRSNREGCRCNSCHADHFWNANRTSEPGLGANECVPSGKWRKPTAFRHFRRRSTFQNARVAQREPPAL